MSKPFRCETCGKVFTRRSTLNEHLRAHLKQRSHQCSKCPQAFVRRGDRIRHEASVHDEHKKYRCPSSCGASFARQDALQSHLKSKAGLRCRQNEATEIDTVSNGALTTGLSNPSSPARKDQCRFCMRICSGEKHDTLAVHLQGHFNDLESKPYHCRTCDLRFAMQELFRIHLQSHKAGEDIIITCGLSSNKLAQSSSFRDWPTWGCHATFKSTKAYLEHLAKQNDCRQSLDMAESALKSELLYYRSQEITTGQRQNQALNVDGSLFGGLEDRNTILVGKAAHEALLNHDVSSYRERYGTIPSMIQIGFLHNEKDCSMIITDVMDWWSTYYRKNLDSRTFETVRVLPGTRDIWTQAINMYYNFHSTCPSPFRPTTANSLPPLGDVYWNQWDLLWTEFSDFLGWFLAATATTIRKRIDDKPP